MAEYLIQGETLTGIADQVRRISGVDGELTPEQMTTNLSNVTADSQSRPLQETVFTDAIANHIVFETDFAPGGIVLDHTMDGLQECYYNGILLPGIAPEMLEVFPYAFIVKFVETGAYRLYAGSKKPYYWIDEDVEKLTIPESNRCRYDPDSDNWAFVNTYNTATYFNMTSFELVWSNHDIPNGSADATEIYFEGSQPVPAE